MPFTDYPNYMGILTLALCRAGAFLPAFRPVAPRGVAALKMIKFSKPSAFAPAALHPGYFLALAGFGLVVALGKHFPIYQLFYDLLPGWKKFRVPVMVLVLTQLGTARVLAAIGLTRLFSLAAREPRPERLTSSAARFQWGGARRPDSDSCSSPGLAAGPIQDPVRRAGISLEPADFGAVRRRTRAGARTLGMLNPGGQALPARPGAGCRLLPHPGGSALGWLALLTRKIRSDVLVGGMAVLSAVDLVPIDFARSWSPLITARARPSSCRPSRTLSPASSWPSRVRSGSCRSRSSQAIASPPGESPRPGGTTPPSRSCTRIS